MRAKVALSAFVLALTQVAVAQEGEPREMMVVLRPADPSRGEKGGLWIEYPGNPRGPARQDAPNAPATAKVVNYHSALASLAQGKHTVKARVTFHEEVGGALGSDAAIGEPAVLGASLQVLDPVLEKISGRVQMTPTGAVLVPEAQQQQQTTPASNRLEGNRSVLLLAVVQERAVELEGWRFSGGRPFLVSAIKGVVLADEARRAAGKSDGYLSTPVKAGGGEYRYKRIKDVTAGEALWITNMNLHARNDYATPFRDISLLELSNLDVDANDEAADDDERDTIAVHTYTTTDGQGRPAAWGFIPLRRLDLGSAERQKKLAEALTKVDVTAPEQNGLVQKAAPVVR